MGADIEDDDFGKHDDGHHKSHHLAMQLKVGEDMIVASFRHFYYTQEVVVDCCWRIVVTSGGRLLFGKRAFTHRFSYFKEGIGRYEIQFPTPPFRQISPTCAC